MEENAVGPSKVVVIQRRTPLPKKTFKGNINSSTEGTQAKASKTKNKNDRLIARTNIENMTSNSFFYAETPPKFVSVRSYGRIAHRFVRRKDFNGLDQAARDKAHFHSESLVQAYSEAYQITPEGEAVLTEDLEFIDHVLQLGCSLSTDWAMREDRAVPERALLSMVSTGQQNYHMLGHATWNIEITRGGREGNNALLLHDVKHGLSLYDQISMFLEKNVSFTTLEHIASLKLPTCQGISNIYSSSVVDAKFKSISVLKKGQMNSCITPLHTAAINPNAAYLKELISVEPNFNIPDMQNWYTIHYAAVCEGSGPLKLLIDKGTPVVLLNKAKDLPLHCAARAGRAENVKILLEAIQKVEEIGRGDKEHPDGEGSQAETEEESGVAPPTPPRKKPKMAKIKLKTSMVNAKAQNGMTALHMAAEKGHEEVVRVLLSNADVKVDVQTSAKDKKLTPLMIACRMGFKNIADILIDLGGAIIEKGDKLKRRALTHAVLNGQNHVVAMLLRRGASASLPDSSGNTPAHYAAAYGWLECLEMLAKADSSCLDKNNDWHLSPLAVAYLKGHSGIVEWLVDGPCSRQISVNCCDQSGISLISSVISCYSEISSKDILKQIEYLISKGADCSLKDTAMNTPLHHFASKNAKLKIVGGMRKDFDDHDNDSRLTKDEYCRCVDLILDAGAGLLDKNEAGDDAFHMALKTGNLLLVEYFLNKMIDSDLALYSLSEKSSNTGNILHSLVELPFKVYANSSIWAGRLGPTGGQYNVLPLLNRFISMDSAQVLNWLNENDSQCRTPLVLLCQKYTATDAMQYNSRDDEDRKTCYIIFEQFLYTMCAVVRSLVSINGEILLQRFEGKMDGDRREANETSEIIGGAGFYFTSSDSRAEVVDDVENDLENKAEKRWQHVNVISYGLMGNGVHHRIAASFTIRGKEYKIRNKLLTTIVECAKEANLLPKLLSERDSDGYTPLLYSVMRGDVDTSLYLMRQGVWLDGDTINRVYDGRKKKYVPYNKTVMMCALERQLFEIVRELNLTREQWNSTTLDGNNAFHFVAPMVSSKAIEYFEFLKGKNVEIKANVLGHNPLHIAVDAIRDGGADVLTEPLEWLIHNTDGIHSQDSLGRLPVHYAFIGISDAELQTSSNIDPIAVVSILEQAMDKAKLDAADNFGNTPLHYAAQRGANVCTVMLLRYGCDANRTNVEGNTPLGIAVRHEKEACALALIQANSNVVVPVISRRKPSKANDESWIWIPKRSKPEPLIKESSVTSLVVRNGWQGIIYMIIDIVGKNETTLGDLLASALQHRTYNLALTLLRMLVKMVCSGERSFHVYHLIVVYIKSVSLRSPLSLVLSSEKDERHLQSGSVVKWMSLSTYSFQQLEIVHC
ncbi:unnamed protein product [Toxocara canis]|uniref:Poly [ADP-ribose] polymerase n=1 Tax=Toxocara canis TaxID=6265 RepID=A0A183UEW8_TOXCA|nr:unnamed protein product [Toxocara canis]